MPELETFCRDIYVENDLGAVTCLKVLVVVSVAVISWFVSSGQTVVTFP